MDIFEEKHDDIVVLKLSGRLDYKTSPGFEQRIVESMENGYLKMVLDFKNLEYISSAGLRVILKAAKELKRSQGKIVLCEMQDYVKEVFEIAGFDTFLPIETTLEAALKCF